MPDTTLMLHPRPQKAFFNPRPSIGKENLQLPVVQTAIQILPDLSPFGMNPKSYVFKPAHRSQRSHGPAHLGLPQIFTPASLKMNLRTVDQQEPEGNILHLPKRIMGLGKLSKPPMHRRSTRGLPLNPHHFLCRPAKQNMHCQSD